MASSVSLPNLDVETLRCEISKEYAQVAREPHKGFHFQTGRPLARLLGYPDEVISGLPQGEVESFAGTGNLFSLGTLEAGEG